MGHIVRSAGDRNEGAPAPAESVEEVAAVLAAARAEANRERAAAKDAAIVLARKMAERIIGHAVETDPLVMRDIASQALKAVWPRREVAVLRLHPDDLSRLAAERPQWLTEIGFEAGVHAVGDATVGRHGCIVETAIARLDARLETQIEALERALRASGLRPA